MYFAPCPPPPPSVTLKALGLSTFQSCPVSKPFFHFCFFSLLTFPWTNRWTLVRLAGSKGYQEPPRGTCHERRGVRAGELASVRKPRSAGRASHGVRGPEGRHLCRCLTAAPCWWRPGHPHIPGWPSLSYWRSLSPWPPLCRPFPSAQLPSAAPPRRELQAPSLGTEERSPLPSPHRCHPTLQLSISLNGGGVRGVDMVTRGTGLLLWPPLGLGTGVSPQCQWFSLELWGAWHLLP